MTVPEDFQTSEIRTTSIVTDEGEYYHYLTLKGSGDLTRSEIDIMLPSSPRLYQHLSYLDHPETVTPLVRQRTVFRISNDLFTELENLDLELDISLNTPEPIKIAEIEFEPERIDPSTVVGILKKLFPAGIDVTYDPQYKSRQMALALESKFLESE